MSVGDHEVDPPDDEQDEDSERWRDEAADRDLQNRLDEKGEAWSSQ